METASDFLGLSPAEAALVEMKVHLSQALRARREARSLSQIALAKRLRSSQSRGREKESGVIAHEPFGRPRARSVGSKPRRFAIRTTQGSLPKGRPRCTHVRRASSSEAISG